MHIVLGGTGQVGSAVAQALLEGDEEVTVITRDPNHGEDLRKMGAQIAVANLRDVAALRHLFRTGNRAFLLNPPADPAADVDREERGSVAAIVEALEDSGLEKVVAQSTYGAFDGESCGDFTVLYELERRLLDQSIPAAINRGAYFMSNWIGFAEAIGATGKLMSFFPADLRLPMVAPVDLGREAARRMLTPVSDSGIQHVEGPEPYSPADVAVAFGDLLGIRVTVEQVQPEELEKTFIQFGFSVAAAASYACMTRRVVEGEIDPPEAPVRGATSLMQYLGDVLRHSA